MKATLKVRFTFDDEELVWMTDGSLVEAQLCTVALHRLFNIPSTASELWVCISADNKRASKHVFHVEPKADGNYGYYYFLKSEWPHNECVDDETTPHDSELDLLATRVFGDVDKLSVWIEYAE